MTAGQNPELTHESVDGDLVVFDPQTEEVHLLNREAAADFLALDSSPSRRRFLQTTAVVGGAVVTTMVLPQLSAAASTVGAGGGASTTTTVGRVADSTTGPGGQCTPGYDWVSILSTGNSYTIPQDGQLIDWSAYDAASGAASMQLEVWRPTGTANEYTLVASSPPGAFDGSNSLKTFPLSPSLSVRAGDQLGINAGPNVSPCLIQSGSDGDEAAYASGYDSSAPALGTTYGFSPYPGYAVNAQATLQH